MPDETPTFTKVLITALGKAQSEFPAVVKNKINPFYNNAPYADLSAVFDATKTILFQNGITVTQLPLVRHDAADPMNSLAGVNTILYHESGEFISNELLVPAKGKAKDGASKYDAQTIAAALTYARRISYQSIVGVAAEDDDGNEVSREYSQEAENELRKKAKSVRPPAKPVPTRPQNEQQAPPPVIPSSPETAVSAPVETVRNSQTLPDDQYNAFVDKAKKLVNELTKAGMKPSPGNTVGQKFKTFVFRTTGKNDLRDLSVDDWNQSIALTEKIIEKKELDTIWKEE